ncbi:MAG: PhzF family phenazine biosynthesis protein [Sphingomonas fennica]
MLIAAATRFAVFAEGPHAGNPATVVRLGDWPSTGERMQALAEHAGTIAFLPAAADDPCPIRWFGPAGEIALCGHGALAAGAMLINAPSATCRLLTARGETLALSRTGDRLTIDLPARMPAPTPLPAVAAALGLDPVDTLAHPDRYAVVVAADAAAVRACRPDRAALAALGDWQVILTAPGTGSDIVSRVWSPGGSEDAATGSAHAVIGPYWARRLGRAHLSAVQASPAGGSIACTASGDRVAVGGRCVVVATGQAAIAAASVALIQPPPSTRSPS